MNMIRWPHLAALSLLVTGAVASPVDAQQRAPDRPRDCAAEMGPLPERIDVTAFAIDGDTLAGVGLRPHIRIWGIQAPELRDKDKQETAAGMFSRTQLASTIGRTDNSVGCRVLKFDRYCRYVAQCTVTLKGATPPAEIDLGRLMLLGGAAYGFYLDDTLPWDPKASLLYARAEDEATRERRGLWPMWLGDKR